VAEPLRVRPGGVFRPQALDPDAVRVVRRLAAHGYQAYLVGGCVRDLLVGVRPKDFDIATSATPRQVKRLFRNSRIIGRRFRLVHVTIGPKVLDVSTFRAHVVAESGDGDPMIRQDNVFGSAGEDARRRDFTINGLFYDVQSGEVIDYVGGLRDLDRRVVETIGDPWTRFREDPVRMLRAIKFAARLDFRLADDVYQAILDIAPDISKAAPPRVFEEIVRLLNRGGAQPSLALLLKTGLLALLLPEVAEAAERAGHEAEARRWLEGFARWDRLVRDGVPVSHHALLAWLLLPLVEEELYPSDARRSAAHLLGPLDLLLRSISLRLRMSRRDTYFIKHILVAQRRLGTGPPPEGRRARAVQALRSREYFEDARRFLEVYAGVTGRLQAEAAAWAARSGAPPGGRGSFTGS
jgi:poly(A) polymerase